MTSLEQEIRFAIGTFTRLPIAAPTRLDSAIAGGGIALGPLVGAGIGLISGLPLALLGADTISRLLAATLTLGMAAAITGALHWDGLADLADGLGSGAMPDRALEIMKRADIGPIGTLTMGLTAAIQVLALALLPSEVGAAGWVIACTSARAAVALGCGWWVRPATTAGLGALVVGSVSRERLGLGIGMASLVAVIAASFAGIAPGASLVAAGIAIGSGAVVARIAARRLGGSNGDVLGATCEVATAICLLILARG